jgi:hypothetical protein
MRDSPAQIVRLGRGFVGTILGGGGGVLGCLVFALGFTVVRWVLQGTNAIDREDDLQELQSQLIGPMWGCALLGACSGFATWFPAGKHRFMRSLIMVFLVSVPFWQIGFILTHDPTPHYKGTDRRGISSSELAALWIPPVLAGVIVSWMRIRGTNRPPPPQSLTAMTLR